MNETFHIAVSCNERYVPGALVALAGVAVNARVETPLSFHVFTEDVKVESLEFMRTTLMRLHANSEFHPHECDESLLSGLPYWAGSRMAAVRCCYADLLPDVDWCLYLDCDILYFSSIEEHFSFRDPSALACVVQEESASTRKSQCRWIHENCDVEIPDEQYFNSGVVLFNFRKMREDGIPSKLLAFFGDHKKIPSPDQDALNAVFAGQVKMLPPKFDRLQIFLSDEKMAERPVIHYVCGNPWLPRASVMPNNRFKLWHSFADRVIWQQHGESCRRCFPLGLRFRRNICFNLLKCPGVGLLLALFMQKIGMTSNGMSWRKSQLAHDISATAIKEAIS